MGDLRHFQTVWHQVLPCKKSTSDTHKDSGEMMIIHSVSGFSHEFQTNHKTTAETQTRRAGWKTQAPHRRISRDLPPKIFQYENLTTNNLFFSGISSTFVGHLKKEDSSRIALEISTIQMENCVQTWAPELVRPAGPPNWCSEPLQWPGAGAGARLQMGPMGPNQNGGPKMDQEIPN